MKWIIKFPNKNNARTRIVIGPSGVGKSTYLAAEQNAGRISPDRIHFAYEFEGDSPPRLDGVRLVHFNMFHPFHNSAECIGNRIEDCVALQQILQQGIPEKAIFLVAPRSVLLKRILLRSALEPNYRGSTSGYPKLKIFELICRIDLVEIYQRWINFFKELGVPVEFLSSEDNSFNPIPTVDDVIALLRSDRRPTYSPNERSAALSNFTFAYQKVDGFEDVTGENADRTCTYNAIRLYVKGPSVLDIGCGIGSFCFALEKEGFEIILGTELKKDRFLAACVIAEVAGSRCKFELKDVFASDVSEMYDTVLMLNVIHHLPDPISALRKAARMTRQTLILEYPTLMDPKFQATLSVPVDFDRELPLIGVSHFGDQDQTFVFSDAAIARILVENERHFSNIEFIPSPMHAARRIAVCQK